MRCAENLVEACARDDESVLLVFTRQIFGLCAAHGVSNPVDLFQRYRELVQRLARRRSRADIVGIVDALVWDPGQRNLAALLDVRFHEWSSVLTVRAPTIFHR